jgi:hypothetical protein
MITGGSPSDNLAVEGIGIIPDLQAIKDRGDGEDI